MTVIVGILCIDGVVIGADSSATSCSGNIPIIEQKTKKIDVFDENCTIMAGTGQVGLRQRFYDIIKSTNKTEIINCFKPIQVGALFSRKAKLDFSNTFTEHGQFGALMAFPYKGKGYLCEFSITDFQPELRTGLQCFASMGSGQQITDPFLALFKKIFWKDDELPRLQDGVFATVWALNHAIDVNPGGIKEPINVATLIFEGDTPKVSELSEEEIMEHVSNLDNFMGYMKEYKTRQQDPAQATELPQVEE